MGIISLFSLTQAVGKESPSDVWLCWICFWQWPCSPHWKKKRGGGKNRAAFAMLNSASGGEAGLKESLTVCHLKGRTRPVSSALSPLSRRSASPRGDFRPPVSHSGWITCGERWPQRLSHAINIFLRGGLLQRESGGSFLGVCSDRRRTHYPSQGTAGDQTETPLCVGTKLDLSFKTRGVCSRGAGDPRGQPDGASSDSQGGIRTANETKCLSRGKKQRLQPPPLPTLLSRSQSPWPRLLRARKVLKRGLRDGHLSKSSRLQMGLTVCSKVRYALKRPA